MIHGLHPGASVLWSRTAENTGGLELNLEGKIRVSPYNQYTVLWPQSASHVISTIDQVTDACRASSRPLILLVHTMHESGIRLLREAGEIRMAGGSDPATLQRDVLGAVAMVIRTGGVIDAALLDKGKDLKVIGRHGVGYDQIDIEAATERGIQVVYTPGANTQSVAEHVFAFLIGLSKHFPRMMAELARGNYRPAPA